MHDSNAAGLVVPGDCVADQARVIPPLCAATGFGMSYKDAGRRTRRTRSPSQK